MKAIPTRMVIVLALAASGAWADDATTSSTPVSLKTTKDYLIGASLNSATGSMSDDGADLKLRPMWAFQWGRFRFASGGASALLSLGREKVDAGLSTQLVKDSDWSVSTSLRLDSGRSSDDDKRTAGLPDIRPTVRGRVSVGYALGPRWSLGVSGSQDLLGRNGGLEMSTNLSYHHPVSSGTWWGASVGASWANATYAQARYGIDPVAAAATGRTAYASSAGWTGMSLGWSMATVISPHWVAFGGVGVSRALGAAADSPLTSRTWTHSANVGLAYRCCR